MNDRHWRRSRTRKILDYFLNRLIVTGGHWCHYQCREPIFYVFFFVGINEMQDTLDVNFIWSCLSCVLTHQGYW